MATGGTTGELYADSDNPQSVLGKPPEAPAPVPTPVAPATHQPIQVRNHRMADERPDGSIRDTSTEALRPGNDLNFRNISDEEQVKPPVVEEPKPAVETPPETKTPEPAKEAVPVPEKVYAGKFKNAEDLEKSYQELEKKLTQTSQEAAELRKKQSEAPPPAPAAKTPQQLAAEQEESNRILSEFATDPKKFLEERDQRNMQSTMVALQAQQVAENWRKQNADLADHEIRVAFEATLLAQSDPELARNHEALLQKATDNFRQFTGKIRSEGAKEALTTETRTIPLLSTTAPQATEQPQNKAPLTADEAYSAHMSFLKEQEKKTHRGLRR